ncbi:hypothetical protein [Rossellomorea sp. DUT-2]
MNPHQLRHSYVTYLINNGAPLEPIESLFEMRK